MLQFNNYGGIIGKYSLKKKELFLDDYTLNNIKITTLKKYENKIS